MVLSPVGVVGERLTWGGVVVAVPSRAVLALAAEIDSVIPIVQFFVEVHNDYFTVNSCGLGNTTSEEKLPH